jgi:hypothetical protein
MGLGRWQRETLDEYAALAKPLKEGYVRFAIIIGERRANTREFGAGIAIRLLAFECYAEGHYQMRETWIADCQYAWTAQDKAHEIARYLSQHGISQGHIHIEET